MIFLSSGNSGQSPQSSYFTDSYWFVFHFLHQERGEVNLKYHHSASRTQTSISYSMLWKGKVCLTASSGYHLRHFFLYLCWFPRCFWFLITSTTFLKVKVSRILSFNSKSFQKWFLLIIPFSFEILKVPHPEKFLWMNFGLYICITYFFVYNIVDN